MRFYVKSFLFLLYALSPCLPAISQEQKQEKVVNNEFILGGGPGTSNFTGISGLAGYNRYFGRSFLGVHYNHLEEVDWLGPSMPDIVTDVSVLANRELLSRTIRISMGAGIARVWHIIYSSSEKIRRSQFGFPVELNVTGGNKKIGMGLSIHYNHNSFNSFCTFNALIRTRLF